MSNEAFDYTNRDYAGIRDQLTAYLKYRMPEWNPDPSDFAYAILEGMAYLGDMMSYYVDRAAQESNILTANDPENVHNLARLHGYTPGLAESAWCLAFISNEEGESGVDVIIPKGTQIAAASGGYAFEVIADLPIAFGNYAEVMVYEGVSKFAEVGVSTGAGNQQFRLPELNIDGRYGMLSVTVWNPTDPTDQELWGFRELLLDAPSGDYVFSVRKDADGSTYIVFGDGVAGRIPTSGWLIGAHYRTTVGAAANSSEGLSGTQSSTLSRFLANWDDPGNTKFGTVHVTGSTSPTGGKDAESLEDIRQGAVRLVRAQRRAVTAFDYENIARSESSVLDAVCQTEIWSRPTIWIAPKDPSIMELFATFGTSFDDVLRGFWENVTNLMEAVAMAGVQPDVLLGTPHFFKVKVKIRIPSTVDEVYATTRVQEAVYDAYRWENARFGESITLDGIIRAISSAVPTTVALTVDVTEFLQTTQWESVMSGAVTSWASSGALSSTTWITPEFYSYMVLNVPEDVIVEVVKLKSAGRSRF